MVECLCRRGIEEGERVFSFRSIVRLCEKRSERVGVESGILRLYYYVFWGYDSFGCKEFSGFYVCVLLGDL